VLQERFGNEFGSWFLLLKEMLFFYLQSVLLYLDCCDYWQIINSLDEIIFEFVNFRIGGMTIFN